MVKAGRLNKVEKFFIDNNTELSTEELAEALDRNVHVVEKYQKDNPPVKKNEPEPVKNEPEILKAMGRHVRNGEKVATVMTRTASELSDATRPKRTMNKKTQEAIFKPFKD